MSELPAASWVNLALQIPLALVIVFLVIRFLLFLKDMFASFLASLARQDELNREFIREQQKLNMDWIDRMQVNTNTALGRLAEEIKANKSETIREVVALTQRVDGVIDKAIMLERLLPESKMKEAR